MALANSATDLWEDFDIDKTIVIDDFESNVEGEFDLITDPEYTITRMKGEVPIPHNDGVGMMLPSVSTKNFMVRAPFIKGLLGVFDFRRFIEEKGYSPIITDMYGKEHDIIAEDIQIIFTKSQTKMHKYYRDWDQYKEYFKKYNCQAGICNVEEDRIKNAKINYQMLQTLTDISDEEIDRIVSKSANKVTNICTNIDTMLDILGVTPYNNHMTAFQAALKAYPQLLSDTYSKDVLRETKDSLVKKYRSGKLELHSKYTFILPDFYALCDHWFGGVENPDGLLGKDEVYCSLFSKNEKLDCLRSPHLYREHSINTNIACNTFEERKEQIGEWFTTKALYTSTKSLISKMLQFDDLLMSNLLET